MSGLRVVVDTNVLVSAALKETGTPAQVIAAIGQGRLEPVVSRVILAEYREVLSRPRFDFPAILVTEFLHTFSEFALRLEPNISPLPGLPDPGDAPFIALALFAGCPVVTGNTRHFPPKSGVEVLTPGECLARIMRWGSGGHEQAQPEVTAKA